MVPPYSRPYEPMYSPQIVDMYINAEDYATTIVNVSYPHRPNVTSYLQNERSSIFPVPMAQLWSGNAIRTPNVQSPAPYGPRPSVFSRFLLETVARIQGNLAGAP